MAARSPTCVSSPGPYAKKRSRIAALWPVIDNARTKPYSDAYPPTEKDALQTYFLNREYGDYQSVVDEYRTLAGRARRPSRRRGTVTHVQHERTDRSRSLTS